MSTRGQFKISTLLFTPIGVDDIVESSSFPPSFYLDQLIKDIALIDFHLDMFENNLQPSYAFWML